MLLTTLLTQIGLPALMSIIGTALEKLNDPLAKSASEALTQVNQAIQSGKITPEQISNANKHTEKMAEIKLKEFELSIEEVNKSLRAEIASQDIYVRRMRPTFGYIMALTWAAQMFGIAYIIIFDTQRAGMILSAMSSLSTIWAVGLSVLGIYVYKRSEEKKQSGKETIFWSR